MILHRDIHILYTCILHTHQHKVLLHGLESAKCSFSDAWDYLTGNVLTWPSNLTQQAAFPQTATHKGRWIIMVHYLIFKHEMITIKKKGLH